MSKEYFKKTGIDKLIEVANNYTEVHFKYESCYPGDVDHIAFESDILRTGFTRKVSNIESVVIETMK